MSRQIEYGQAMHGLPVQNSALDRPRSSDTADLERNIVSPDGIDRLRDYSLTQHRRMEQQVPALQRYPVAASNAASSPIPPCSRPRA